MKGKGWDARLLGVVAMALAFACESTVPIAAPTTSRAGVFSAGAAAPTNAAQIGWEIFGPASATAAERAEDHCYRKRDVRRSGRRRWDLECSHRGRNVGDPGRERRGDRERQL
ncbi:MAG TPA: hypothetical protein VN953_01470 [Gemmatimonadales bacterium]|nr:hypothetical protein [Gemmatimonadales bacterium]